MAADVQARLLADVASEACKSVASCSGISETPTSVDADVFTLQRDGVGGCLTDCSRTQHQTSGDSGLSMVTTDFYSSVADNDPSQETKPMCTWVKKNDAGKRRNSNPYQTQTSRDSGLSLTGLGAISERQCESEQPEQGDVKETRFNMPQSLNCRETNIAWSIVDAQDISSAKLLQDTDQLQKIYEQMQRKYEERSIQTTPDNSSQFWFARRDVSENGQNKDIEMGRSIAEVKWTDGIPRASGSQCRKVVWVILPIAIFAALGASTFIPLFLNQSMLMKRMEEKLQKLEIAMAQNGTTLIGPVTMARSSVSTDVRPHVHFTLKPEEHIPLTKWNQRVLQWSAMVGENSNKALQYDSLTRSLAIREPGTYFVYNQIYVYRHITGSATKVAKRNHTLFHAIYNRPFNYPPDRKPMTITESTLSNCWNENANIQIHTSYQGIIVKLQTNDHLLVALQDYNDELDTLDPKSTFFGAFKL